MKMHAAAKRKKTPLGGATDGSLTMQYLIPGLMVAIVIAGGIILMRMSQKG